MYHSITKPNLLRYITSQKTTVIRKSKIVERGDSLQLNCICKLKKYPIGILVTRQFDRDHTLLNVSVPFSSKSTFFVLPNNFMYGVTQITTVISYLVFDPLQVLYQHYLCPDHTYPFSFENMTFYFRFQKHSLQTVSYLYLFRLELVM